MRHKILSLGLLLSVVLGTGCAASMKSFRLGGVTPYVVVSNATTEQVAVFEDGSYLATVLPGNDYQAHLGYFTGVNIALTFKTFSSVTYDVKGNPRFVFTGTLTQTVYRGTGNYQYQPITISDIPKLRAGGDELASMFEEAVVWFIAH